jgi:hypothetical protein
VIVLLDVGTVAVGGGQHEGLPYIGGGRGGLAGEIGEGGLLRPGVETGVGRSLFCAQVDAGDGVGVVGGEDLLGVGPFQLGGAVRVAQFAGIGHGLSLVDLLQVGVDQVQQFGVGEQRVLVAVVGVGELLPLRALVLFRRRGFVLFS